MDLRNKIRANNSKFKALAINYDFVLSLDTERDCYSLSQQEVAIVLSVVQYQRWETRWYSLAKTSINKDILDALISRLEHQLMYPSEDCDGGGSGVNGCVPIGSSFMLYVNVTPAGALPMDGVARLQTDYPDLMAMIPAHWKTGTQFILPDMTGRMLVGQGFTDYLSNGQSFTVTAGVGRGELRHTLTSDEIPTHAHQQMSANGVTGLTIDNSNTGGVTLASNNPAGQPYTPLLTKETGGGLSHNNLSPYLAGYWFIQATNCSGVSSPQNWRFVDCVLQYGADGDWASVDGWPGNAGECFAGPAGEDGAQGPAGETWEDTQEMRCRYARGIPSEFWRNHLEPFSTYIRDARLAGTPYATAKPIAMSAFNLGIADGSGQAVLDSFFDQTWNEYPSGNLEGFIDEYQDKGLDAHYVVWEVYQAETLGLSAENYDMYIDRLTNGNPPDEWFRDGFAAAYTAAQRVLELESYQSPAYTINGCNVPDVWSVEIDVRYSLPSWIEIINNGLWVDGSGITFDSGYFAKVKMNTGPVTLTAWGMDVHVETYPNSGVVQFGLFHGVDEMYGSAIDQFNTDASRAYNAEISVSDNSGFNIWATRNTALHIAYIQKIRLVGVGVNPFI